MNTTTETQAATATPMAATSAAVTKGKRRTIPKLSAAEASKLPGAIVPVAKKPEPGFVYSILFGFPITEPTWSATEASTVHGFASQLDVESNAKGLGGVTSVVLANGNFDVTLTLIVTGTPASNVDPAANALAELKEFLSTASGTPYKVRVNGTTITPGVLP